MFFLLPISDPPLFDKYVSVTASIDHEEDWARVLPD
jgi:hypothetical protein